MKGRYTFENLKPLSKPEVEAILACNDSQAVAECLLSLTLYEPNQEYVWRKIEQFSTNREPGVRGIAVLCVGHMVRIHGHVPAKVAVRIVRNGLRDKDEFVRGHAVSAADDLRVFAPRTAVRLSSGKP